MSDPLPVYPVVVTREDDLWVAVVDGLPGGATDVQHFEDLPDAVRDMIATLTDSDPQDFWIVWQTLQGSSANANLVRDLQQWDYQVRFTTRNRDAVRKSTVHAMRHSGLSYRAIADVVGLSHQRVAQVDAEAHAAQETPIGRMHIVTPTESIVVDLEALAAARTSTANPSATASQHYLSPVEANLTLLLNNLRRLAPADRQNALRRIAAITDELSRNTEFLHNTSPH